MHPTQIAAYLALFIAAGGIFLLANLVLGWFLRPSLPNEEKLEIYECGEPTIGSSFVQFDLRFYVVALLFLIFDVEVAFFFPWATVFGKANHLRDEALSQEAVAGLYAELGSPADAPVPDVAVANDLGTQIAQVAFMDILVFFAVVMVGFFYVWKRGDIDWVRAVSKERARRREPPSLSGKPREEETPVLAG